MKENRNILKHFFVIGGGTAINLLIGLLTTPLITRIVNPSEYGQWSLFTMYASIGLTIFCLGLDQALVRYYYTDERIKYRKDLLFFCWRTSIAVAGFAALFLICAVVANIVKLEFDSTIVILLCLHIIILIFNRFGQLVLRITYQTVLYSVTTILQKLIYVAICICAIKTFKREHLLIMAIATMVSYLIPAVVSIISQRQLWHPDGCIQISKEKKREIVIYGLPFIVSLGITTIFQSIDKMSLNYYSTYEEVGIYSSAMTLVHIFAILQTTFNSLWTPMATEHFEAYPNEKIFYRKGNQYITVLMFSLGISLIFVKDVFSLLLGEKYRDAAFFLPFLIFNPIMYTISESTCMGIGFAKKTHMNVIVASIACITNIIGNMLLVPTLGGRGAAISTGISYIVFWMLRTVISNRYYYINFELKKFAIVSAVTVAYAFYNTFHRFDLICVIGYIFSIGILILLYRNTIRDMFKTIKPYIRPLAKIGTRG